MGNDLLGACLLCGSLLLGMDLAPPPGWTAELGAAYATVGRRHDLPTASEEVSDTTGKFVMMGLGQNRAVSGDLGAGTPGFEWRFRIAVAPAHDEQKAGDFARGQTTATGNGRFENFALLVRLPVGERDSIELSGQRKNFYSSDLVNEGGEKFTFNEERTLATDRIDAALGWRHRWKRLEVSGAISYVKADGSDGTAGAFHHSGGGVYGAAIDARARKGKWIVLFAAQRASGSLRVGELSAPDFVQRNSMSHGVLENYRMGLGFAGPGTSLLFSASMDRSILPFVAFAVLGTEQLNFEHGFHPESSTRQILLDLRVRQSVSEHMHPLVFLRWSRGREVVAMSDTSGFQQPIKFDVNRQAGFFGHKEAPVGDISIGIGVEISLPGGR